MITDSKQKRCLIIFCNSVRSKESRKKYFYHLNRFLKFYHISDPDSVLKLSTKKLQIMVEDYIIDMKDTLNPNTVSSYYFPIKTFLESNDVDLKWRKFEKLLPDKVKPSGRYPWTTEEIRKMIRFAGTTRNMAIILFLTASGCRIGALPGLKLKHLIEMPLGCKAVIVYEGSREEYVTFLTLEASRILDEYLNQRRKDGEVLSSESPLFREVYKTASALPRHSAKNSLVSMIDRTIKKAKLRGQKIGARYDKQTDHAFRKRFMTILKLNKDIPVAVTEKLSGHNAYKDEHGNSVVLDGSYVTPLIHQLFDYYKKAISDLTIDDIERVEAERKKIEIERSEIEKIRSELEETKKIVQILQQTRQKR